MDKTTLYSYIASLGVKHQAYTEDQLYHIGLMFRELPKNQRDWKALNDALGNPYRKYDSYRKYVSKRFNRELLKKNSPSISATNQSRSLFIEKQSFRDVLTEYRKLLRTKSRSDDLKKDICNSILELAKVKPLDFGKAPSLTVDGNECVFGFGDPHIGLFTDSKWNHYNYEIAKERAKVLTNKVIAFGKLFNINTIHFCNLGDLIHGIIHKRVRFDSEFGIDYQIPAAAELIAEMLTELQKHFKVIYRSVTDNHGRPFANKEEHLEEENFNHTIDYFLKERLKDSRVIFADEDNLDDTMCVFKLRTGKYFGFAHGHLDTKNKGFQNFVGATKKYIDYLMFGHYHNPAVHTYQDSRTFFNGSFSGCDPYATNSRLYGTPCQKMIVFDKYGDITDIDIMLNK